MAGSPSIALIAGAEAYEARTKAPLEKLWLGYEVTQFELYDRTDAVKASADSSTETMPAAMNRLFAASGMLTLDALVVALFTSLLWAAIFYNEYRLHSYLDYRIT